jgi:hypothetical protein
MIEITDKHMLRRKVLDACIKKQQSLIDDFKARIKAVLETEGLGNEEKYDNTDASQRGQASEEINTLNEALSLANEEMSFLQHLKLNENDRHKIVAPGAIVITDKAVFFVSVSIERFGVDGKTFFGISTKSPLYITMKGLPEGSLFLHNGVSYKIEGIW